MAIDVSSTTARSGAGIASPSSNSSILQKNALFYLLKEYAERDCEWLVRSSAVKALSKRRNNSPELILFLKSCASNDQDYNVREHALKELARNHSQYPELFDFFYKRSMNDSFKRGDGYESDPHNRKFKWQDNPRQTAIEALLTHNPNHPKTLELLRDRALNDPDKQLREWTQEQLDRLKE